MKLFLATMHNLNFPVTYMLLGHLKLQKMYDLLDSMGLLDHCAVSLGFKVMEEVAGCGCREI
jgi:hypothetical protein